MNTLKVLLIYQTRGCCSTFYMDLASVVLNLLNIVIFSIFWYSLEMKLFTMSRKMLFTINYLCALGYMIPTIIILSDFEKYNSTSNMVYMFLTFFAGLYMLLGLHR